MQEVLLVILNSDKIVYIASFIAINDDFSLLKFTKAFLCFFVAPRLNTTYRFQFIDESELFF